MQDMALAAVLVLINLLCFHRTLSGYFLADDFVHIPYLHRVFSGHPEMLLANFTSNWMQTEGTQFYRPLISLTLALDYLIGGANPLPYHISNTIFQIASSLLVFWLGRRLLLPDYGWKQSTAAGFFAGALFAAFPLHPEVVSWVIGRVDSVCTMFYLASFWLFLRWNQEKGAAALVLALAAFSAALLSKEMAVTLPAVLLLYGLFSSRERGWLRKVTDSLGRTQWFWAALLLYLTVRSLALGTVSGGYTGSIGEGLSASLWHRWFGDGSWLRVVLPFNAEVFSARNGLRKVLPAIYLLIALSLAGRLLLPSLRTSTTKLVFFAAGWAALSLLPAYQVWNLTSTLQGSRFAYLATAPLCLLITLAATPLFLTRPAQRQQLCQAASAFAFVLLAGLVVCYAAMTVRNNIPWAQAGAQVRALRHQLERTVRSTEAGKQLVLLNLPQRTAGAHMLYNATMLSVLLAPPLSRERLAGRVVTFEPMTFGDSGLIIASRLRRLLDQPDRYDFYRWDEKRGVLVPLELPASRQEKAFRLTLPALAGGQAAVSPPLNLPAAAVDFVDVELVRDAGSAAATGERKPEALILSWTSPDMPFFSPGRQLALPSALSHNGVWRFPVSQHKSWLAAGIITAVRLQPLSAGGRYRIAAVTMKRGDNEIPALSPSAGTMIETADGVARTQGDAVKLSYDASRLTGATGAVLELSKPNSWFEHYSGQLRDRRLSPHRLATISLPSLAGEAEIPLEEFPSSGYYQVRLAALGADGEVAGYVSDPVNIQVASPAGARRSGKMPARDAN